MQSVVLGWTFSDTTGKPAVGEMSVDTGFPLTATVLKFNVEAAEGNAEAILNALAADDLVRLQGLDGARVDYLLSGAAVTDGKVREVPVGWLDSAGVIANGDDLSVLMVRGTVAPAPGRTWPVLADCVDRLGVDPADPADTDALQASLDSTVAMVLRAKPELLDSTGAVVPVIADDYWQGIVILACLDYRAANSPNGFAGYDGGASTGDGAEKFRAQQLLRMDRWQVPRAG